MLLLTATAFDLNVDLVYQALSMEKSPQLIVECDSQQFYLAIPDVVRFLALPADNRILIEKTSPAVTESIIHTWLYGTVMAYILQYQGYLVLHGSAVLMNHRAVIFSGQSGAGKSTLANAFLQKGYPFITDDLIVIKRDYQGQYGILPGPAKLKLWKDAMLHFNQDMNNALLVNLKVDKYAVPVMQPCQDAIIPIAAFYELNLDEYTASFTCERLQAQPSLKTFIQNAYRYFMLKPLGKLQTFFQDCSALSQQIAVHKITRTPHFHDLPKIIQHIEINQGITR